MDEEGLYVFPSHHLEWERNKTKLLECNRKPNHPVARIKAVEEGRHAKKVDSNKAGGLLPLLYLCRESKVMLVVNLKAEWGLFNGAPLRNEFPEFWEFLGSPVYSKTCK